jgi:hypothetical protein
MDSLPPARAGRAAKTESVKAAVRLIRMGADQRLLAAPRRKALTFPRLSSVPRSLKEISSNPSGLKEDLLTQVGEFVNPLTRVIGS